MRIIGLFIFTLLTIGLSAQGSVVQLIGENEDEYEKVVAECKELLISAADNDMKLAYQSWTDMLLSMETAAQEADISLDGVKMWVNVFWKDDGTIDHLYYYPKPNSKNMDFEILTSFLIDFSTQYQMGITNDDCFSHYGSATFPVRSRRNAEGN